MTSSMEQFAITLLEAWNSHDAERVSQLHSPDYEGQDVSHPETLRGVNGIRHMVGRYLEAFPDLRFTQSETVTEWNHIAVSWTAQGTHRGRFMNIPPTGRQVSFSGISMFTLKDGKVSRALWVWDVAGLLRAIGLLPELSA